MFIGSCSTRFRTLEEISETVRQLLAKLIIGLIVLTGVLPLLPHNDFGNAAHAHGIVQVEAGSTATPDSNPGDKNNHPVVDCNTVSHVFITAFLTDAVSSDDGNIQFPDYSPRASSRIIIPIPPPPNA
tara:strand:+ start:137 stop:520 length:384 start_codon:yes stop_codon:yes gene_type:complete